MVLSQLKRDGCLCAGKFRHVLAGEDHSAYHCDCGVKRFLCDPSNCEGAGRFPVTDRDGRFNHLPRSSVESVEHILSTFFGLEESWLAQDCEVADDRPLRGERAERCIRLIVPVGVGVVTRRVLLADGGVGEDDANECHKGEDCLFHGVYGCWVFVSFRSQIRSGLFKTSFLVPCKEQKACLKKQLQGTIRYILYHI